MAHIKRMVMHGFKSFARRTEVVFDQGVNVILGPNGSGKSNISDALCFVLGRLSIKSMRAAKAKNLLFMGSKYIKPAKEASVELVFDNHDKTFSIDKPEINLTRVVRHNGQSIYKINGEVKTRAEVIEMLAQAGIDPHGFNLILQGQIQSIVRMHPEERRKIVEEVAGISIYESRKEKSLHELEKTDEKLREISAILRERTSYLKNLDRERAQALRFKELETLVRRIKASIIQKRLDEKLKEFESVFKSINEKSAQKDKIKEESAKMQAEIEGIHNKINEINRSIQQATGLEQETLHTQIANLKADLEGIRVRRENYENRRFEIERRISEMGKSIPELEREIQGLKKESPLMAKKSQELKKKKEEFAQIEEERNKLVSARTELHSIREIVKDKEKQIARNNSESENLLKQIEEYSRHISYRSEEECSESIKSMRAALAEKEKEIEKLRTDEMRNEKLVSISEVEIDRAEKVKGDVSKIDVCPLCQSKITGEHKDHVFSDANNRIEGAKSVLGKSRRDLEEIKRRKENLFQEIKTIKEKMSSSDLELMRLRVVKDRKEHIKKLVENEKFIQEEIRKLEDRRKFLEIKTQELSLIQEKYDAKMLEIEEISSRTEEDVNTTLLYKERELENVKNIIKRSTQDLKEVESEVNNLSNGFENKKKALEQKEAQERDLNARFKKMFEQRENLQKSSQEKSMNLGQVLDEIKQIEEQINYLKIGRAKIEAEKEACEMEMQEFSGLELIKASAESLEERLKKNQEALQQIGSINMRALEVYDQIKKEYDNVQDKVNTLEREKQEILKIIEEIDQKKKKSFMKTFKAINTLFSENFSKLSTKGVAFLEIENSEDIFAGGVNIVVKLAKGKYFDVTSLSGGEQTLVALSLLFAIQEYKPYHFYVFDEIDAALDKRNSERLAGLLQQYIKAGQYIIITHNDAIIMNSDVLYGVSMHDGVSKILSLKIKGEPVAAESEGNTKE